MEPQKILLIIWDAIKSAWKIISTVINSLLLTLVYIFGIGLTSIISKILGKRFLETKPDSKERTYWTDLNLKKKSVEEYKKQF